MAIHLNLENLTKHSSGKDTKLHWMPCVIKTNGEAKVSKYFDPIISEAKDGVVQASFRGYPLLGKQVSIPKSYTGVVLKEINERLSEEAERDLYGIHSFDKLTYWNWDVEPSENDKVITALDWLEVAKVVSDFSRLFPQFSNVEVNKILQTNPQSLEAINHWQQKRDSVQQLNLKPAV